MENSKQLGVRLGILYESRSGQTEKIARRIAETVAQLVETTQLVDIGKPPADFNVEALDVVILGAPIYFSRHTTGMKTFIRKHREALSRRPSFFFSVSLNANHESTHGVARKYVTKLVAGTGWTPKATATFAGALLYRDYNWFVRLVLKFIAASHGGDTDTSRNYEYTNWDLVDEFARACVVRGE